MALTRDELFFTSFRQHAEKSVAASKLVAELMRDPSKGPSLVPQIRALEEEGDGITHSVVTALHQTWITPLDREEIHSLVCGLDDVLDYIEAVAVRVELYDITTTREEAVQLADCLVGCAEEMKKAIDLLTPMKEAKPILDLCISLNKHEHDADEIYRRGIGRLFRERPDPIEVMKWRDILDALETATDRAEDVANILEGIVLEHG